MLPFNSKWLKRAQPQVLGLSIRAGTIVRRTGKRAAKQRAQLYIDRQLYTDNWPSRSASDEDPSGKIIMTYQEVRLTTV